MKIKLLILSAIFSIVGCATEYTPTPEVLSIKSGMDNDAALMVFQRIIQPKYNFINICGTKQFGYDKSANMTIEMNGIHLTAYGLGQYVSGDRYAHTYTKKYYPKHIKFSQIERIDIYTKDTYPVTQDFCFTEEDYRGSRQHLNDTAYVLWPGVFERFTVRVPERYNDEFVAAVSILMPDAKITVTKR